MKTKLKLNTFLKTFVYICDIDNSAVLAKLKWSNANF